MAEKPYQRILLKLSGEALLGNEDYGIDPAIIGRIAGEVQEVLFAMQRASLRPVKKVPVSASSCWMFPGKCP